MTSVMEPVTDLYACPTWCARQDCAPPPDESLVRHMAVTQVVRAAREELPADVELTVERWVSDLGAQETVVLGVRSEPGEQVRYTEFLDLTAVQARRMAALLVEYAALIDPA